MNVCLLLASWTAIDPSIMPRLPDSDEIIVTGERVPRRLEETSSSVVVATDRSIDIQAAPDRLEQVLATIPNVQLGSGGDGPTIRGEDTTGVLRDLAAFLGGARPRATLTVDGRAVNYNELAFGLASIWDVARVEVYRSPQTTTQGQNSIAGAIFIATADPTYDWHGRVRLLAGNFATRQASGVISGPLAGKELAFRLSGDVRRSRTSTRITSSAQGIDPNRDNSELVRLKLLAEPQILPGARLELTYAHVSSRMPQVEGVEQPFRRRRDPNATYGVFRVNVDSLSGTLDYKLRPGLAAKTTTSFGDAAIRRFAPPGLGETRIGGRDVSTETVVDWRHGSRLRLTGGVHYQRTSLHQTINLTAVRLGQGRFTDRQNGLGLFGEASWRFAPRLTLATGLRYQRDRQDRSGGLAGGAAALALDYHHAFDAWLPKISLAYEPAGGTRIGVFAQRAYNPGGTTLDLRRRITEEFREESLWDFEAFARVTMAGGRLSLSANAFYYKMYDSQRPQDRTIVTPDGQVAGFQEIANAPRAFSRGLEAQAEWQPDRRFTLGAAIGLLDTRITRTITPTDPLLDKQFQRSPRLSATATMAWRPIPALRLSAQMRHNGRYFSDDAETADLRVGGSTTIDAKASWTAGRLTLSGYLRNAFDEFHLTYRYPPFGTSGTAGDPREFGLSAEARF